MIKFNVKVLNDRTKKQYMNDISLLLQKCDKEFIPPLSSRKGSLDTKLIDCTNNDISGYRDSLLSQDFIIALDENDKVTGFLSYVSMSIFDIKCNYVSTIITDKDYRKQGVARALYKVMEEVSSLPIMVRTWSTNYKHMGLLNSLGFGCIKTIKNDRGTGIDTVYYIQYQSRG